MNRTITLIIALVISTISFSQSTDLDREYFKVSYVKLPSKPILDDSKRTYSSNNRAISLSGFSRLKSNGTLDINYRFNGTEVGTVDIKKTKHEKKDKEGNVTSVSYTYKAHITYTSSASLSVSNAYALENNYQRDYSEKDNYESGSYSSYKLAQNYYNNNRYKIKNDHTSKHKNSILNTINSNLNRTYGYVPSHYTNEHFWILGSKKHPEFQKHKEAFEAMKATFEKMKHNQPLDELKAELQPIMDYFNSVIPNYVGTKKKMRKMRYASYYNIAKMYYYLDMPEKTKEYAQKIIENDYDKSDGKYFNRLSNELIEKFKINKINTRHFEVVTEDLTNIEDDVVETTPASGVTSNLELNKAYLINKANDTILIDIETININKIGYDLKTVQYDNNGAPIGTRVEKAKNCKELLFVDGLHFKNINFKESAIKSGAADTAQMLSGASEKLCKVLFESEKISLYIFNNQETVILTQGSDKGKSTLSTSYTFGFKKNLSKLAAGCPTLIEKVNKKMFKNNPEDLIKFCEELSSCK